jgi:hypothetical protein
MEGLSRFDTTELIVNPGPGRQQIWNLADRNINPALLLKLFDKLPKIEDPLEINVAPNRLGDMSVEEFQVILHIIEREPNLRVRFGYDILIPRLEEAMNHVSEVVRRRVHVDFPFEALRKAVASVDKVSTAVVRYIEGTEGFQKNIAKSIEHEMTKALIDSMDEGIDYTPKLEHLRSGKPNAPILMQIDGIVLGKKKGRLQLVLLEVKSSLQMGNVDEKSAEQNVRSRFPDYSEEKLQKKIEKAKKETVPQRLQTFLKIFRNTDAWMESAASKIEREEIRGQKAYLDYFKEEGVLEDDVKCAVGAKLIKDPALRNFVLDKGWYLVTPGGNGCKVEFAESSS